MKRTLITLLLITLTKIISFSSTTSTPIEQDSIVSVTASDLKYANLIFVEHKKLLTENSLLYQQLGNCIDLNNQLVQVDSLRKEQIFELNKKHTKQINDLNKEIKKKNNSILYWQIGGITISVGLILFLLFK